MPIYCYETEGGIVVDRVFPMGEAPECIFLEDGDVNLVANRSFAAEGVKSASPRGWPMTCLGSGVNAAQAGDLRAELARKGVPTEVTRDGDPIYTSSSHRNKALKARGMFDKNGYK